MCLTVFYTLLPQHATVAFEFFSLEWRANKMLLLNNNMTGVNVLCNICVDGIAPSKGCCCWNWWDNGHGERKMLVSFVDGYCKGFHSCLRAKVACLAQKLRMNNTTRNMDYIVKKCVACGKSPQESLRRCRCSSRFISWDHFSLQFDFLKVVSGDERTLWCTPLLTLLHINVPSTTMH